MSELVKQRRLRGVYCGAMALALANAACGSGGGSSSPGVAQPGSAGMASTMDDTPVDPGRVAIHRLNNTEYNNTIRDLLGTSSQPANKFLAEEGLAFDNTATALGMTAPQYEAYFNAARDLLDEAVKTPAQLARFMTCTPTQAADPCARQIIETFGFKIYRRPLEVAETERALKVYNAELARSKDGTKAIALTFRAMLSAASFLYRIEYDANPTSITPHPLSAFELASRLSYLHWSTMPDDTLFGLAKSGALLDPTALEQEVDRLLADGKGTAFVESFAGQWLGIRKLVSHSVVGQVFPTYTVELSEAIQKESYLWFTEFLSANRPLSDWFGADFNYVNDTLAKHYGLPAPGMGAQFARVEVTTDHRRGFLGLASFLTQTSFPSRTSPTLRGAWVLSELLCAPPQPPPAGIPKLDESATPAEMGQAPGTENVKARLERHRSHPSCNVCHNELDPIGLGLERYDGVGRYREAYGNSDAIDPAGTLPNGMTFAGPDQLGDLIGQDPRFSACVANKLYTYALGRDVEPLDAGSLGQIQSKWSKRGMTIRNLMKEVTLSSAFRSRRGEAP